MVCVCVCVAVVKSVGGGGLYQWEGIKSVGGVSQIIAGVNRRVP